MLKTLTAPYAVGVASRVGAQLTSFALIVVASRQLDLGAFGAYAVGWAFGVICTTLVYTGVYHTFLRSEDEDRDRDTAFWLMLGLGGLGTATMLAAAGVFGGAIGYALAGLSLVPLIGAAMAWLDAHLIRAGRVRTAALAVLGGEVAGLAVALMVFRAGYGVEGLIAARYASAATLSLVLVVAVRRVPGLRASRARARAMLSESWPLWGSTLLSMTSNYGADLVLAAFLTPSAVGAYRAGSRVANTAADVVLQPLGVLSWARFARLEASGARDGIRAAWRENMGLGMALVLPAMVSISLLAEPLVATLFDPGWGPVAGIVAILALARATEALSFLLEPTMACLGRGPVQFRVRLLEAALLLALLLTLGRFGGEAAALAILGTGLAIGMLSLVLMVRVAGLSVGDLVETFLPGLVLTTGVILLIWALDPARGALGPLPGLLLTVGAVAAAWLVVVAGLLKRRVLVLPTP